MDPSEECPDAVSHSLQYSLATQATVCVRQWRMISLWRSRVFARKPAGG